MERNYFDSKASVDGSLEKVMKYINVWRDILLEDAKRNESGRNESGRKTLDEEDDIANAGDYYDYEEAKNDSNWYEICLEAAKRYDAKMKDIDEDKEDNLEDEKDYDDEEARDDAAFADFDRKHVSGYDDFQSDYDYYRNGSKMFNPYDEDEDDEDDDSKYLGEHFGAGFEIDEPRPEDYMDNKAFEDDLAAYKRFVEAGEECVRRGLEKPDWADSIKIDNGSSNTDDEPSSDADVIVKIYVM